MPPLRGCTACGSELFLFFAPLRNFAALRESRLFPTRRQIHLATLFTELSRLFVHAAFERFLFRDAQRVGVVADVLRDFHRAEMRAAHRTEVRGLCAFLRQRLVVEFSGRDGIEREIELIFPPEFKPRFGEGIVPILRAGMAFGEVGGVRGDLVGDDAVFHVLLVWQAEVFLGRDVAEHRAARASRSHTSRSSPRRCRW